MPRAAFEASTLLGFTAKKVSSVVVCRSETAVDPPAIFIVWYSTNSRGTCSYVYGSHFVDTAAVGQLRLLSDTVKGTTNHDGCSLHLRCLCIVEYQRLPCLAACLATFLASAGKLNTKRPKPESCQAHGTHFPQLKCAAEPHCILILAFAACSMKTYVKRPC